MLNLLGCTMYSRTESWYVLVGAGTWPNTTMWNCWSGTTVKTLYYWMVSDGEGEQGLHSVPEDKPVLWQTPE